MNAKDLKSGDVIKLHKSPFIGLVERKEGRNTIVWFFSHGQAKVVRRTIGNNTAIATNMKDETKTFHQKMLLAKYFENGMSNQLKEEEINFK